MSEDNDIYFSEEETLSAVRRFEEMVTRGQSQYFDVVEFESIIDYYLDDENTKQAALAVDYAYRMHPYSLEIQFRKAEMLAYDKRFDEALPLLERLERIDAGNVDYLFLEGQIWFGLGDFSKANLCFERSLELVPYDIIEQLYRISTFYLEVDEINLAIRYLLRAYSINPKQLGILFDIGYCYDRINDFDRSLKYYNQYLDINPFSAPVWYNVGIVYTKTGDFEKAIEAYDFCLAVDPGYASAYYNKGNTLASVERYAEAVGVFQDLLELEPENPRVLTLLGECFEKTENMDAALDCYNRAIAIDPEFADAHYGVGVIMATRKEPHVGIQYIKKAIELDPEQYDFWLGLGKVNLDIENVEEALNAYREAATLNPDEPDAYLAMAEVYLFQENFGEVERLFEELGPKFEGIASMNIINAAALYLSHRRKEALDALRAAKRIDPDSLDDFFTLVSIINDDDFINMTKLL
jgi:tetratricopeptide (TPR) repeat protein